MDKNLILAVVLSMLVYLGWFGFVEKRFSKRQTPAPAAHAAPEGGRGGSPSGSTAAAAQAPAGVPAAAAPPVLSASPKDRPALERSADRYSAEGSDLLIHPQGAAVVSFKFHGPLGQVELVENPAPGFFSAWPELTFRKDPAAPGISYSAKRPDGLLVRKEFIAGSAETLPRLKFTFSNEGRGAIETGPWAVTLGPGLGTVESEKKENPEVWRAVGFSGPDKGTRGRVEKIAPGEHPADRRWVAVDNRYFLAAAVPAPGDFEKIRSSLPPAVALAAPSAALEPGQSKVVELPYFLGPKAQARLAAYGLGLERAIDLGFFAQLGRLTLRVLVALHDHTRNWGWAIILLTLLIQTLMFPLTYKSLKAAAAMKRLQPEMARLQQQFGKDPARLNTEMMALYKKSGANPLGGCLPMLLQMPVFIALFNTLRNSWELHGATWIFWIKDLSSKDPYYVLPLLMGGLMFFQNRLNPAPADPAQAKMMQWMPAIFTFMFLKFPSGLVLYWMTNSVVSTVQQLALREHFEKAK